MINYDSIIERYYTAGCDAHKLLMAHSRQVACLTAQLCERLIAAGVPIDKEFAIEGAMLHDIGMFKTHAPGIHCHGELPYICHGYLGRELLDSLGLFRHALVCERHTGAGLALQEIIDQGLPLPHREMLPLSLEEKVVCYADKFYSKSRIEPAKPLEAVRQQLSRYGEGTSMRFEALVELFGEPSYEKLDC